MSFLSENESLGNAARIKSTDQTVRYLCCTSVLVSFPYHDKNTTVRLALIFKTSFFFLSSPSCSHSQGINVENCMTEGEWHHMKQI